jgi:hypothetical protein
MRGRELKSDVNWLRGVKKKYIKQMDVKQDLDLFSVLA